MKGREEYQEPVMDIFFIETQEVLTGESDLTNGGTQDGDEGGEDYGDMGL